MSDWNTNIINEFRAKGGKGITNFGDRLLLLTVRGAKTGTPRTYPLAYHRNGDSYVVIASKGGAPTHPDWYRNVSANPDVEVEIGTQRFTAHARPIAEGPERDALYEQQAQIMPGFRDYEVKTAGIRTIPVVVLEPVAESKAA
jgi:deazaflavin-dependent oxidoreductase (nitroreductase family)